MFGWLANLLVKSPVVGSNCPCCEGQKERLKEMQKAILSGELENAEESDCMCCQQKGQKSFEMTTSYRYKL